MLTTTATIWRLKNWQHSVVTPDGQKSPSWVVPLKFSYCFIIFENIILSYQPKHRIDFKNASQRSLAKFNIRKRSCYPGWPTYRWAGLKVAVPWADSWIKLNIYGAFFSAINFFISFTAKLYFNEFTTSSSSIFYCINDSFNLLPFFFFLIEHAEFRKEERKWIYYVFIYNVYIIYNIYACYTFSFEKYSEETRFLR